MTRLADISAPRGWPLPGLAQILPRACRVVEHRGERSGLRLADEDLRRLPAATAGRREEFAAGRSLARRALAKLGFGEDAAVGCRGRAPVWPPGVCGSITHTEGYVAAAVAMTTSLAALGIDAERVGAVPPRAWNLMFAPEELAAITAAQPVDRARYTTLLFSAKEAFFKAQHPLTTAWIDPCDAIITPDGPRFSVCLPRPVAGLPAQGWGEGAWTVDREIVLTGYWATTPPTTALRLN